jgi:hypothetical protein
LWESLIVVIVIVSVDFFMLLIYFFLRRKDLKKDGKGKESICPFFKYAQSNDEFERFIERIGKP